MAECRGQGRGKEPKTKATRAKMNWGQVGAAALPLLTAPAKSVG